MATRLSVLAQTFKREFAVYRCALRHPQTPRGARWLLGAAVGYALLPFDLIPDFLPVIGQLDDLVIVPGLVWLTLKWIHPTVMNECRAHVATEKHDS